MYIVMTRVLGGEWERVKVSGLDFETDDMAKALGMKETVISPIHEAMVIRIEAQVIGNSDYTVIRKTYELVE